MWSLHRQRMLGSALMPMMNAMFQARLGLQRRSSMVRSRIVYSVAMKQFGRGAAIRRPLLVQGPEWISIGDRTFIRDFARIEAIKAPGAPDPVLSIGSDVLVEEDLHVTCTRSVVIEDQVLISARAYISDTSHAMPSGRGNVVTTLIRGGAIRIGFGTMIGVGVSVLSGVSIGRYCVIGANSVVTHDIPDGMVAAGSPARVIKPNPAAPPQRTTSEPSGAR